MWTTENRPRYDRDKLRYPSDLTDEEWSLAEPLIPPAKRGGLQHSKSFSEIELLPRFPAMPRTAHPARLRRDELTRVLADADTPGKIRD
jgi:hypothetical protein